MRVNHIGATKKSGLLPIRAIWFCSAVLLIVVVLSFRTARVAGQTETPWTPQAEGTPTSSLSGVVIAPSTTSPQAQQINLQTANTVANPKNKEIVDDTANLMKLANTLKAEVDKTSADTLSVSVIRKAGEIEQLAHKMRAQ
jgi:hypothetical protein